MRTDTRQMLQARCQANAPYLRGGRDMTSTITTTAAAAIPSSRTVYQSNGTSMASCSSGAPLARSAPQREVVGLEEPFAEGAVRDGRTGGSSDLTRTDAGRPWPQNPGMGSVR
jgi:hypothetical protein